MGLDSALGAASGEPTAAGYTRPVKSLLNLTTVVDSLAFSPDEQARCCLTPTAVDYGIHACATGSGSELRSDTVISMSAACLQGFWG